MAVLPAIVRYADGLELRIPGPAGPASHFLPAGEAYRLGVRLIEAELALAWARAAGPPPALVPGDDPGDTTGAPA